MYGVKLLRRSPARALLGALVAAALLAPAAVPTAQAMPDARRTSGPTTEAVAARPSHSAPARVRVPEDGYGFADGMSILSLSPRALKRELDAVALTGATWLRVPVNWSQIEQRPGRYQWATLDRVVRAARRHDLTILANVSYAPPWARAFFSDASAPPQDPATYAAFCERVAKRYRTRIRHWEIWNEPNLDAFFGGSRTHASAPERYTRLLKPAYRAIHRAQRRPVVVAGALSAATNSSTSYSMSRFVERMYAAGARGHFDALALHPYTGSGTETARQRVYRDVRRVRRLMVDHRNQGKQIWWSELGHSTWTGGVSLQRQRALILDQLRAAADRSYVGPAFVYAIRDSGNDPAAVRDNFGSLLTHDFEPKPLARSLHRRASPRPTSGT
ncbi:N/A [soil metagenome]